MTFRANAREYVDFLSNQIGVEIGLVSTGPERSQTIVVQRVRCWRSGSRLKERSFRALNFVLRHRLQSPSNVQTSTNV